MKRTLFYISTLLMLLALALTACSPTATPVAGASTAVPPTAVPPMSVPPTTSPATRTPAPAPANPALTLATTTSTQETGILDVFIPLFEQQTGYQVQVQALGAGAALKTGQKGAADVLLLDAPSLEKQFMTDGWGKDRALVMHNDFVIVGPAADPAKIKGLTPAKALQAIETAKAIFITRGDASDTNLKELTLWSAANLDVHHLAPTTYIASGQGMAPTLQMASDKGAYTLSDRATFLENRANLQLIILSQKKIALLNVYHAITVSPDKLPNVNYAGAQAFLAFLTDPATQTVISKFGVDKYHQATFFADATKTDAALGLK